MNDVRTLAIAALSVFFLAACDSGTPEPAASMDAAADSAAAVAPAVEVPTETMGDDVYVVVAKDNPFFPVAAWEADGTVQMAMGSDAASAPDGAVTYEARQVVWPTAQVRVLHFAEETGGVLHPITDETILYVQRGTATVGVGDATVTLAAGDVASFPSGALRNAGAAADATIVTWNAPSLTGEDTPTHVPGASVELRDLGFLGLKRYTFPGNSVRVAIQRAGLNSDPVTGRTDSLIYVTGGPMGFTENGQAFTVSEGDFIREIAGLEHFWNVETESEFVTTSGKPLELEAIDPSQATDIPPAK